MLQDTFITEIYYENNSFFGSGKQETLTTYVLKYLKNETGFNDTLVKNTHLSWDYLTKGWLSYRSKLKLYLYSFSIVLTLYLTRVSTRLKLLLALNYITRKNYRSL